MAMVGIDLGTTYSAVAILKGGRPEIIPNRAGDRTTPSVVGLGRKGQILVGKKPKNAPLSLMDRPIEEVKRLMGENNRIPFGGKEVLPQEISAFILQALKADAEVFLGEPIQSAVITIPAYFNENARRATQEAGEIAGLVVGAVLDEPTAAILAYGLDREDEQTVMIYDLGGGTFDVSIIDCSEGYFQVVSIDGNNHLGGRDLDRRFIEYTMTQARNQFGIDLESHPRTMKRLPFICERCKWDLSEHDTTQILIEAATPDQDLELEVSRETFEGLIEDLVRSTVEPMERALEKANLDKEEIDHVLLVGGSTRIPLVFRTVRDFFGREPKRDINPDESVAMGAAIYTTLVSDEIKGKCVDQKKLDDYVLRDKDGERLDVMVVPRTPFTLGIGVNDRGMDYARIIEQNSAYPISQTVKNFYAPRNPADKVGAWVYEGEEDMATQNIPLGRFDLSVPRNSRPNASIWVTFSLNQSRVLEVRAEMPDHPESVVEIRLEPSTGMTPEEQERIREEHSSYTGAAAGIKLDHESVMQMVEKLDEVVSRSRSRVDPIRLAVYDRLISKVRDALATGQTGRIGSTLGELNLLVKSIEDQLG